MAAFRHHDRHNGVANGQGDATRDSVGEGLRKPGRVDLNDYRSVLRKRLGLRHVMDYTRLAAGRVHRIRDVEMVR